MRRNGKGAGKAIAVPDSSINVRYVIYAALIKIGYDGGAFVGSRYAREGSKICGYMDLKLQDGRMRIPEIVHGETRRAVDRVILGWIESNKIGVVEAYAMQRRVDDVMRKESALTCKTDNRLLRVVVEFYNDMWTRPEYRPLKRSWYRKNRRGKPAPGINDMMILSTAAGLAGRLTVHFLVADIDFVVFGGEIERRFGIRVMSPWRRGGWPR